MSGAIVYQDLSLNPIVNAPNVIEPDSGTTTTTETVTHTQTTGGMQGDPLIIHHGPKANQALHCYINDMHTEAMGLSGTQVVTREAAQFDPFYGADGGGFLTNGFNVGFLWGR